MRRSIHNSGAAFFALVLLAGCGTIIRPQVSTGGDDRTAGFPQRPHLIPQPTPDRDGAPDGQAMIDKVCRVQAMRSGWIATRYTEDAGNCPESTDPENPYTAAIIERYSNKQVGSTMIVCADQPVPRQWVREYNRDASISCQGARVRNGEPTAIVIRRVSGS